MAALSVTLAVRVTPRSHRDEIVGWQDGILLVRLRAPPVDGKANGALCRLLAGRLDIATARVRITSGAAARLKRLRIAGLEDQTLKGRLDAPQ